MKQKFVLRNVALLSSSLVMLTLMHPLHADTYAAAYTAQKDAGKSDDYATAYAIAIAAGKPAKIADVYAAAYENAKIDGKSDDYATAYAYSMAEVNTDNVKEAKIAGARADRDAAEQNLEQAKNLMDEKCKSTIDNTQTSSEVAAYSITSAEVNTVGPNNTDKGEKIAAAEAEKEAAEQQVYEAQKLVALKCTGAAALIPDPALIALAAAGAVITVGGVAVVASSGSSSSSGSDTSSSTTIDTFNGIEQYYVYEPAKLETTPSSNEEARKNLIGLDNLSHLRDVFHSSDNKEHMGVHTNEAHSLEERGHAFKQAEIVTAEGKKTYNMTFIDAIGAGNNPQPTYLDKPVKVSGLYLQNTNLDIGSKGALTADAVSVKKGTLDVNGSLSVGAFLLDSDATLTGGDKISFNNESTKQIIDHMKTQLPDRYRWADFGKFDLLGTFDKFTVSKGMNVYLPTMNLSDPFDGTAPPKVTTLKHDGGILVLSASQHTRVKDYAVSGASVIKVKWDNWAANLLTPLMTVTDTCNIGNNKLALMLDSIPTFKVIKDAKFTVLFANSITGNRDAYKQDLAGGRFEFKTEKIGGTTTNAITVTCLVATNEVAAASRLSATLSRDILGKTDGTVKGRFAAMEIPAAVSALDAAVSDAYLAPVAASAPSYFSIHQYSHTAGGWNHVDEASDATLTSMGFNAGHDVKLGFSVSTPVVQTPVAAPTVGAHLLNNGVFMDAFYNGATQAVGSTVGYQLEMFSAGMTYMFDERSGVDATNPMGRLEVNNLHQHRILFNVGLNKRIEKMDFSATVFAEALRYAQGYDLMIDGERFHLNGHSFDRNCGANLQAKANFDTGFVSAAIGLAGSAHKVEPTTSVSFNFTY